jgi:hypothetical protein
MSVDCFEQMTEVVHGEWFLMLSRFPMGTGPVLKFAALSHIRLEGILFLWLLAMAVTRQVESIGQTMAV